MILHVEVQGRNCKLTHNVLEFVFEFTFTLSFIIFIVSFICNDNVYFYRHYLPLANRTKQALYDGIDKMFRLYNHADFVVSKISCDQEFKPIFDQVKDELGVLMQYAAKGEHEPTAERNNQHIKSGVRTLAHRTLFKALPSVIVKRLGRRVADTSNYYPAKGGISKYYSPRVIILKRRVDFAQECVAEIGTYVQGYGHETHRNQRTRTVDGIYLGPDPQSQTSHIILNLNTGAEVTRSKIKILPMTKQVIAMVEDMARAEGVRELRTYSRRTGAMILDADLLAGVDPDELWDEEYDPDEDTPPKSDDNLRSERIDDDEVDDLIDDAAEEFIHVNEDVIDDEEYEDKVVERIMQRIRRRQQEDSDDSDDETYAQPQNPEEDIPMRREPTITELELELSELENEEDANKSIEIMFEAINEEEEDSNNESLPDLIPQRHRSARNKA